MSLNPLQQSCPHPAGRVGRAGTSWRGLVCGLVAAMGALAGGSAWAWQPTRPVEFVVPAGTGGGADQMARFIQGVVQKHNLMSQPIVVVNRSGGAGAEGFLDMKNSRGNPHKIVITLSNLFTTPLATGIPFNWRDLTPVSMMALDQFVLWVHADSPYKTAGEFMAALRASPDRALKVAGTGSRQEDHIITVMLEQAAGRKMTYVPFRGGGDVAVQLVGKHVDATVNNPIEAESHWRSGALRALCVMDGQRMPYRGKVTATQSWADLPTCKSAGIPVEYQMLRGIFTTPGATPEQVKFYEDLLARVRALPEWKEFMEKGAFNQTTMSGQAYFDWVARNEQMHRVLMRDAGFLSQ